VPANSGSVVADHFSYLYLSKVFSKVTKVEYIASDTTVGNLVSVGVHPIYDIDKTGGGEASETLTTQIVGNSHYNFGFGTPVRCRPYRLTLAGSVPTIVQDQGKLDIMNMTMKDGGGDYAAIAPAFEHDRATGILSLMSGWLIGQSDPAVAWKGDPNKWKLFSTTSGTNLAIRLIRGDPTPDTAPLWDFHTLTQVMEFTVAFGSTIRTSKGFEVATYGSTPLATI